MIDSRPAQAKRGCAIPSEEILDRQILVDVYDQYHPRIYRYIYRQIGDVEFARDLAADVFQRFLQAVRGGADPADYPGPWLYRTAHNLMVDHFRRQRHRQHLPLQEGLVKSPDNPAEIAERRISAAGVRAALQRLSPDQRQVIVLKYLEGLSNQEVAAITEKSVGAVKSLQHRALVALQEQLAPVEVKGNTHAG